LNAFAGRDSNLDLLSEEIHHTRGGDVQETKRWMAIIRPVCQSEAVLQATGDTQTDGQIQPKHQ